MTMRRDPFNGQERSLVDKRCQIGMFLLTFGTRGEIGLFESVELV